MNKNLFLGLFLLPFGVFSAAAQDGWSLRKDKEGIKIFSRASDHSKINEVKADFNMQGTLSEFADVMIDLPNHVQWAYGTKSCGLLKKVSDCEIYFYTELNCPWPLTNRDLIVHMVITQDPGSKIMKVVETDIPNYIPEKKQIVRVPVSKAVWTVTPVDKNMVHVNYQIDVDPGGAIPAWLVNMFATKCPFESFKSLRTEVMLNKYRLASFSFISNK
jgi:hypothetical protein